MEERGGCFVVLPRPTRPWRKAGGASAGAKKTMARWKAATKALKKLLAARVGPEREAKRKFLAALGVVGAWARGRVRERDNLLYLLLS